MPVIEVALSPQFDICYALADLASPRPRWGLFDRHVRSTRWFRDAKRLGWSIWLAVPDILEARAPAATVDELLDALRQVSGEVARDRLVEGLFHGVEPGSAMAARKREWLAFVGLDTGLEANPTTAVLRREGAAILQAAIAILERFAPDFQAKWDEHAEALEESRARAAALARNAEFPAVAERLKLKVDIDRHAHRLRALRGGFELDLRDLGIVYLLPSLVNHRGYWTVAERIRPATAFFPFVDPDLPAEAAIDPWLVSRALGDPTRAAILRRLNVAPMTSAELRRALDLSKANISHHIFQLREAGLVDERQEGRSVRLSLRRSTLNALSSAFRQSLPAPRRGKAGSAR